MENSNIPKIIHYCWFGNNEKSELANKCLNSWKRILKGYKFIEWNETNFDLKSNKYLEEAYSMKKFAFVSDYVRVYALYKYGGIYMDTDVEVLKSFDELLLNQGFVGFENNERISTAILGFSKNNEIIKEWLESYNNRRFIVNKKMDMTTNVTVFTKILLKHGLIANGKSQKIEDGLVNIYPQMYFSPYSVGQKKLITSKETFTIHWLEGSWVSGKDKIRINTIKLVKRIIGVKRYEQGRMVLKKIMGGEI